MKTRSRSSRHFAARHRRFLPWSPFLGPARRLRRARPVQTPHRCLPLRLSIPSLLTRPSYQAGRFFSMKVTGLIPATGSSVLVFLLLPTGTVAVSTATECRCFSRGGISWRAARRSRDQRLARRRVAGAAAPGRRGGGDHDDTATAMAAATAAVATTAACCLLSRARARALALRARLPRQHKSAITTPPGHDISCRNHNKNIPCGL